MTKMLNEIKDHGSCRSILFGVFCLFFPEISVVYFSLSKLFLIPMKN